MATETETTTAPAKKAAPPAPAIDAAPQILGDEDEHLYVSPHDMHDDIDPAFAGDYQLTHGCVRLPVADGKGGFLPRGKVYRTGAKMRLNAVDAYRFLEAGVVKRIDGKRPDKVEKPQEQAA